MYDVQEGELLGGTVSISSDDFISMIHDMVLNCHHIDEWVMKSFDELFNLYNGTEFDCYTLTICNDMVTVVEKVKIDGDAETLITRSMFFPAREFYTKYGPEELDEIDGLGVFGFSRYINFPSKEDLQKYDQFGALLSL